MRCTTDRVHAVVDLPTPHLEEPVSRWSETGPLNPSVHHVEVARRQRFRVLCGRTARCAGERVGMESRPDNNVRSRGIARRRTVLCRDGEEEKRRAEVWQHWQHWQHRQKEEAQRPLFYEIDHPLPSSSSIRLPRFLCAQCSPIRLVCLWLNVISYDYPQTTPFTARGAARGYQSAPGGRVGTGSARRPQGSRCGSACPRTRRGTRCGRRSAGRR